MTDSKVNDNGTWQNLDWEKKVAICQQAIANQDALLYASVVIFIALEAMFFSVIFSDINLPPWMNETVPALGIVVAVCFMFIFKRRGDSINRWGTILHKLWQEVKGEKISGVPKQELLKHYCASKKWRQKGWRGVWLGWRPFRTWLENYFVSTRRFIILFTPILVILMWIVIIVIFIVN